MLLILIVLGSSHVYPQKCKSCPTVFTSFQEFLVKRAARQNETFIRLYQRQFRDHVPVLPPNETSIMSCKLYTKTIFIYVTKEYTSTLSSFVYDVVCNCINKKSGSKFKHPLGASCSCTHPCWGLCMAPTEQQHRREHIPLKTRLDKVHTT